VIRRIVLFGLVIGFLAGMSIIGEANSMYVIAEHHTGQFDAWNIEAPGVVPRITFQATYDLEHAHDPAGVAVDADSATLFITSETDSGVELVDAITMTSLGSVAGHVNLAGIDVDEVNDIVYAVRRGTGELYVYDWDPDADPKTLTLKSGYPKHLPKCSGAWGLALDEINGLLYVADSESGVVRVYDVATLKEDSNFAPSIPPEDQAPVGIAVDRQRGFVYTTAPDGSCAAYNTPTPSSNEMLLTKYNVDTAVKTTVKMAHGGMGIAVDEATGYVYVTGGCSGDDISIWDSNLVFIESTGVIGNPAGIAIGNVSYNPLNLAKNDTVVDSQVYTGYEFTYKITYDNKDSVSDATNVTLVDSLPGEVDFVSETGAPGTGAYDVVAHTVSWDIGTLVAGYTGGLIEVVVKVNQTAVGETTVYNYCTIDSDQTPPTTVEDATHIVVIPNKPPVANAGPDQTVIDSDCDEKEDVTLDGSKSYDPDGTIESYVWMEGGTQIATGKTPPSVSLLIGTHTITLTVTDNDGATDTDEVKIVVALPHEVNTPDKPSGPRSGQVDELLEFSSSESVCNRGHPVEYRFNWNSDGEEDLSGWSSSTSASHRYSEEGTYQVKAQARCSVVKSVTSGWSAAKTVTIGPPSGEHAPIASASDISGQPETMYPDRFYTVTAKYYDADGRDDLNICYLRLNHPSRPLTVMWYQVDGNYGCYAGEEGDSYLTIDLVRATEISASPQGYELAWTFKINDSWPEVENAIDFGVFASDDGSLDSGDWHYDDTNASFVIATLRPALVTDFQASDGEDEQSTLSWTNPSHTSLNRVLVQRKTTGYPTSHSDGETRKMIYVATPGKAETYVDEGLSNNQTYYYAVFSCGSKENWNDNLQEGKNADTGIPGLGNHPPETVILDASVSGNAATLTWTASDDTTPTKDLLYSYRLVRPGPAHDDWSSWSFGKTKKYTYLSPGDYSFQVRAKDANEAIGPSATSESLTVGGKFEECETVRATRQLKVRNDENEDIGTVFAGYGGIIEGSSRAREVNGVEYMFWKIDWKWKLATDGKDTLLGSDERIVGWTAEGYSTATDWLLADDVYWLAKVITNESQGEEQAQMAVGHTVLNRRDYGDTFGDDIHEVALGGYVPYWTTPHQEPTNSTIIGKARDLLAGEVSDPTTGATHFFSPVSQTAQGTGYGPYPVPGTSETGLYAWWAEPKGGWAILSEDLNRYITIDNTEWKPLQGIDTWDFMFYCPYTTRLTATVGSPVELRVTDSEGRVTGLVNGEVLTEIPESVYHNGTITIYSPFGFYQYDVEGINGGSYDLTISAVTRDGDVDFVASDISTQAGSNHQYTVRWDILAQGEQGVTLRIDLDGNGIFERTITSGSELTAEEFGGVPPQTPITNGPNPVPDTGTTFFYSLPVGTSTAKLMVLSATSGRLLFETSIDVNQTRFPTTGTWDPVDNDGVKLANGPYLYVLIANGQLIGQGKMVIQR